MPPTPNLDYVFDDPADGEPGRDRMLVHGVWELLLALGVVGICYLLSRERSGAFSGENLRSLLLAATILGALTVGVALTLRTGAVNLAVGPTAAAAAIYYADHAEGSLIGPLSAVIGLALAVGAIQGLVVVGLHVPGWAAGLGTALALAVWIGSQDLVTAFDGYSPGRHATYWFGGLCALSVLGGLAGLFPAVRRAVGRFRPVGDPADRRGFVAALITLAATAASAALAAVAGVLLAATQGVASGSTDGLVLTGLAVGAALLGGTSAYGRRGGIFGTVLAVVLLTVTQEYVAESGRRWAPAAFAAAAIGLGLLVTRMVERFGRPDLDGDEYDDDWTPTRSTTTQSWTAPREPNWQTSASSPGTAGLWGADDAWNR